MIKAILFDFDGVLVHTEKQTFALLQSIAEQYGYSVADELFPQRMGKKMRKFFDEAYSSKINEDIKTKIIDDFYQEHSQNVSKYTDPISETVNFIREYSGPLHIGITSINDRNVITEAMRRMEIDHKIDLIVSGQDIINLKPHPEVYTTATKRLRIKPDESIAIEDSLVGAQSAARAGCHTYIFMNGYNKIENFSGIPIKGYVENMHDFKKLIL